MDSLLEQIERGTLWQFPGGIHPPEQKSISNTTAIARLPLPEKLVIPIKQHIGANGVLLVKKGEAVLKGQPLTAIQANWSLPVHAPTSGTIEDITTAPSAHPSALPELSIILKPDGKDEWAALQTNSNYQQIDKKTLVDIIHNAGVAGMGGAGFPTYVKADTHAKIDYLIVNGVECEPYITADDRLMREHAAEIVSGIEIMQFVLSPERVIVGIEDNKPDALLAMQQAAAHNDAILVRSIPTKYPSGGEKQLIKVLTSKEVPSQGIPADIGVIVQNVGTLYAVHDAVINGKPLLERVVTITGNTITRKGNVWALLGTEIKHLLDVQGFTPVSDQRVIMGGPMMGFTLPTVRIPVVKTTNCILAPDSLELAEPGDEKACIRCSACADACPQTLLPQQLQWLAKGKEYDKLEQYNLFDCIECGACSYVCPSEIPLVQYYRVAKAEIREQKIEQVKSERAKVRFELRKERLEREMEERQNRHKRAAESNIKSAEEKQKVADALSRVKSAPKDKDAVAAAIARAKAKKAEEGGELLPDNSEVALERERRKEQARKYKEEKSAQTENAPSESGSDSKKDAVAAAIARAKAKKAAQAEAEQGRVESESDDAISLEASVETSADDKRKASVAAAIARAKAKKAAQAEAEQGRVEAESADVTSTGEEPTVAPTDDKRKAAVAAAIARAKAKKAAQAEAEQGHVEAESDDGISHETSVETSANDKRKAAVAAAIARAKAKKAAQAETEQGPVATESDDVISHEASVETSADDKRKAAVSAAIARAKAKKAAQAETEQGPVATESDDVISHEASVETSADDKRKAAVAAAIARAKAKKAAQAEKEHAPVETKSDDLTTAHRELAETSADDKRKAAVAAAIARAKAKKAAKENESNEEGNEPS
ncbi:electron transport complex subunit RsxC [Pseudoalteromonas xiamenensis]|uniref:electron transport complex subunit RsxC n=1 Tax=Pseudoalteromonas xiamenensis TaxID=882626 RepID=UPI0027E4063A|nr:electron transport complex subunit RsxC [Pseudoalteromonas xiamenensis]WMN59482.1 electron transport complex subunit RsxC [Pseudoalteromonas xiamenensis]